MPGCRDKQGNEQRGVREKQTSGDDFDLGKRVEWTVKGPEKDTERLEGAEPLEKMRGYC
jgi:hypothetical protein